MAGIIKKILNVPIKTYLGKELKCFLFLVIYTFSTLIFPMFVSIVIDKGIIKKNIRDVCFYSFCMLIAGLFSTIFQYFQQTSFYKLGQELTVVIRKKIYEIVMRSNTLYWDNNNVGDLLIILEEDIGVLESLLTSTISSMIVNVIVISGICLFILSISWKCGVLILVLAVCFAFLQKRFGNKIEHAVFVLRRDIGNIAQFTNETFMKANDIQASGYEKIMCQKYEERNRKVMASSIEQMKTIVRTQSVGTLFNVIGLLIVIVFGSLQTIYNKMTVGTLFTLTVYVQRLYGPIIALGNSYIELKNVLPKINKILEVLDTPYVIKTGNYKPECRIKGNIEFKDVCFSYKEKVILNKFTLSIHSGEIVGIVGKNGIGKSTLFKLLFNLCTPDSGAIFLDGRSVSEYENEFMHERIGYVGQESFMISGELRNVLDPKNICADLEIKELMDEFQLDINRFKLGLDTYIDENHRNLSGGEFQKISLIRAFLENKDVYFLDEPTSAMDSQSEEVICDILYEKLRGKTAVIITHRPYILKICTKIVEFENNYYV